MPVPKRSILTATLGLAVVAALLLPGLRPYSAPRYTVTDLGVLPGDTESGAFAVNSQGVAAGYSSGIGQARQQQACVFQDGKVIGLGIRVNGGKSYARGINSRGEITGELDLPPAHHAFLYSHGKRHDIGTLPGFSDSQGLAINDGGEIVGDVSQFSSTGGAWRITENAFLYSHSKMTNLTTLPGMARSRAGGINAAGQIAGSVAGVPFLCNSRTKTKMALPLPPHGTWGRGFYVNGHGQVTGSLGMPDGKFHVIFWHENQIADLGTLPGESFNFTRGLNNRGVVVGSSFSLDSAAKSFLQRQVPGGNALREYLDRDTTRAFVSQNGKLVDLNTLISADADWTLNLAYGINNRGQIVGQGLHHGQERAFLLTPVR